jgi:glycosyltransferase involved in cell wall biosynthesis
MPTVERGHARLVYVGRFDHLKRVDELMKWLDTEVNPVSELLLIGDGPLRTKLEQQAQTLTYLKCIFLGWKSPEEQDRLIRSSDILVLNSLLEGEPLVIREARARGMKILVRSIVGTRGVTARKERFDTQSELIDRILIINDGSYVADLVTRNFKKNNDAIKREKEILALIKIFHSMTNSMTKCNSMEIS